jgi:hypothetical protein
MTTVAFTDADNFDTPMLNPAPSFQLLRDINHPSHMEMPIVQTLRKSSHGGTNL